MRSIIFEEEVARLHVWKDKQVEKNKNEAEEEERERN